MINTKKDVEKIKEYSLSNDDFDKILEPDTNIFTYPELENVRHIDEVFDRKGRAIMLYLTENSNSGHWISLIKKGDTIEFYDPYGFKADTQGKKLGLTDKEDKELNTGMPLLTNLVKKAGYTLKSNKRKSQPYRDDVNTCGRHIVFRTLLYKMPMDRYNKLLDSWENKDVKSDDIITILTDNIIKNK